MVEDPTALFTRSGPIYPAPDLAIQDTPSAAYGEGCQVPAESVELVGEDECWFGDPDGATEVVMVGDSKMLQWLSALDPIARQEGWRLKVHTKSGCGFAGVSLSSECHTYNAALSQRLGTPEHAPDMIITSMVRGGGQGLGESVAEHLRPAVDAGARVVVVADNPSPTRSELPGERTLYGCVGAHPDDYLACSFAPGPGSGTPALTVAAEELDVPLVDLSPWVCPTTGTAEECPPVIGRTLLFRQGSHLTATFIRSLTPVLHHELVVAGFATTPLDEIVWQVAPAEG
jgi:hypothetical protein